MRVPRFHLPMSLTTGAGVVLPDAAFHHAVRVLRLRPGAELRVFDGGGGEYTAVLERIERREARIRIGAQWAVESESPLAVTLLQGIARGERMDYSLQKAVELGVHRVQPIIAARSVGPFGTERLEKRLRHWQGVIIGACEQCGRNRLPELTAPLTLTDWLAAESMRPPGLVNGQYLRLEPSAVTGLAALPAPRSELTLLVGPEGGLDPAEAAEADAAGFIGVRLGPRVLRTETAGVAALAIVQALWGDLG